MCTRGREAHQGYSQWMRSKDIEDNEMQQQRGCGLGTTLFLHCSDPESRAELQKAAGKELRRVQMGDLLTGSDRDEVQMGQTIQVC